MKYETALRIVENESPELTAERIVELYEVIRQQNIKIGNLSVKSIIDFAENNPELWLIFKNDNKDLIDELLNFLNGNSHS